MRTAGSEKIPITVELQEMFSYEKWGTITVIAILAVLLLIGLICLIRKLCKKKKKKVIQANQPKPGKLAMLKSKYQKALAEIAKRHENKVISDRIAYQEMSRVIRRFVFEATGIKVQNYTLEEIQQVNLPQLYYLIAECYKPEFDEAGEGNAQETISKARKVIEEWN